MTRYLAVKIWLLALMFLFNVSLCVSARQVLAGPPTDILAASSPQTPQPTITLTPTSTPPSAETPPPPYLWVNHGPGSALVNTVLVEGDDIWTATNGEGVVRWNRHSPTFKQYNRANGLIHDKVRAIAIDPAGHKWFGTEGGVSEFDGQIWTNYTTANGLAHNKVVAIAVDTTGHKWFGTWGGGLSYFDSHTWTTYTRANGLASNYIHAIAIDPSNHVWVATPQGVNEFDGRQWRTYTAADGLGSDWVHAIAIDPAGHKWFGTTAGLTEFDGQTWRTYTIADGLVSNYIRAIAIDPFGSKWIATAYGLSRFDGQVWTPYNRTNGLPHSHLTSIAFDSAGVAWLGTLDGVIEFDQGQTRLHTLGALGGNRVRAITIDPAGHKWFATNRGASRFDDHTWTTYTTAQGLIDNDVRAIAIDPAGSEPTGRVWFGTAKGVSTFDGQKWLNYTVSDGLVQPQVNAIAIDPAGHKWFGTASGVSEFDGHTWRSYTATHGLVNDQVTAMVIDPTGAKWFGTAAGVSRFDGQTWTSYTTTHGLPDDWVTGLTTDPSGQVWAVFSSGSNGGVRRFDGQTWIDESSEGVGSDYSWNYPLALVVDRNNRRWVGVLDGLIELEGEVSRYFTYADGLASDRVSALAVEKNGKIWVGTDGAGVSEGIAQAEVGPAVSAPPATPVPAAPLAVTLTPTASLTRTQDVPLPTLLLQLPLTPPSHTLSNIQLDSAAGRLYVTDSNHQLHILETQRYQHLATLPQVNALILDTPHQRLYTANEKELIVRDAATLTTLETIVPPGRVIFNHDQHQVYIANRIYDAVTLKRIGLLPDTFVEQGPGILGSDFNPARNEIYLAEGDPSGTNVVYSLDPETLQISGDLLPEVSGWQTVNFHAEPEVFSERNLIAIHSGLHVAGHGAGRDIPLRFMDATTLDEFTDWGSVPPIEEGCNYQPVFAQPINGLIYRGEHFTRYDSDDNLLVYDLDGNRVTWRDGLALGRTNPNTNQMYLWGEVYDLAALSPVGKLPVPQADICVIDSSTGRIYAKHEGDFIVMAERGGQPEPPLPPEPVDTPSTLPGNYSYTFLVRLSPDYVRDHTLFIINTRGLYRSRDDGQTWVQLHGGLSNGFVIESQNFAISPNFATDQTLFASGSLGSTWWDPGVYRSTDGGDTWQPMWNGLTHLRVEGVLFSPNYAKDHTVIAYTNYSDLERNEGGYSAFCSTDSGLNWTLAFTSSYPSGDPDKRRQMALDILPSPSEPSSTQSQTLKLPNNADTPVRVVVASPDFASDLTGYILTEAALFRSLDGGDSWQVINSPSQNYAYDASFFLSPNFKFDRTLYLTSGPDLFRSTDGGDTWERWRYELTAPTEESYTLVIKAISPLLADGSYRLFVSSGYAGQFWALDPATAKWETVTAGTK